MELSVLILAAGKGTRMRSALPKVLQPLAGRPLLAHVLATAEALQAAQTIVVYGHGGEMVQESFSDQPQIVWAEQAEQLGTGHAARVALAHLDGAGKTLILYGDVPLTTLDTLRQLVDAVTGDSTMALLTANLDNPTGYGRIVRDASGAVRRIVEQKDATPAELTISEINTGIYCVPNTRLQQWLPALSNANAQGEYYLTDIVAMAADAQGTIHTAQPAHLWEVDGVNDKLQLSALERLYQRVQAERLMRAGVTMTDPARFDLRGELLHGNDVVIEPNVMIEGRVEVGSNVLIGANCQLRNCVIGDNVIIKPNSLIDEARVGRGAEIGPFARLRPGTELDDDVHIGNFVEVKKSRLGVGTKANHLAYIGDADVGARVNIGAGSITCNYDGANKHQTVIGDDAFIGTNSSLIAPVTIGKGSTTGAGSAISRNVPDHTLAVARGKQVVIEGWQRPKKNK